MTRSTGKLCALTFAAMVAFSLLLGAVAVAPVSATHGDTTGTVTTAAGNTAISGATVTAYQTSDDSQVATATTDANGSYSMHLSDDEYRIQVVADNYTTVAKTVTLTGGGVVDFSLDESMVLSDKTHSVNNDSEQVYVEVQNTTDYVTATFYGVDSGGNETQVGKVHLTAGATEIVEHRITVDPANYSSYRVEVTGTDAEIIESGVVAKLSGGGGGVVLEGSFASWTIFGIPVWLLVIVAAVLLYVETEE